MTKFFQKRLAINGLLVNYYAREGKLPALLFLHGWRAEGTIWFPVLENFETENSIYCLDLPGFGKSELPREPYGVENYSEIVSGFISKLGLKNIVIVGHSFGGRIAIKLASKHPGFLRGIVLVDSAGFVDRTFSNKLKRITAKLLKPIFKLKLLHGIRNSIYRLIGSEDYIATPQLRETYLKVIGEDLSEALKQINVPTTIIWG
ncbi:alpha/beta fold hydrolase, partial [Nocardioides sp.]|uniref:alpha/beta fold hydrolase n=1 Tax=Nocardioides sp. TaxID=35761 RepID=UPI002733BA09